ncbi:MAG: hypothetical protein KAH91_04295, partial [Thermoplasmatales archaeon]|nr:hypothetical protein [Thermoplasmatales archaeon]
MKKAIVACFFAIIMMLVPVTAVSQTTDIKNIPPVNLEDAPEIYIPLEELDELNNFINANYEEGEDKDTAEEIRDSIFTTLVDDHIKVDMIELETKVREYGFQPIPVNLLNNVQNKEELNQLIRDYWLLEDLFGILVDKIIQLIKDRLGWVYELFDRSITLFIDGLDLVLVFIEDVGFLLAFSAATIFNYILLTSKQGVFSDLLANLFQGNGAEFIDQFLALTGYLAGEFKALVQSVKNQVTGPLKTYLQQIIDFLNWLSGNPKPWAAPVYIYGSLVNLFPIIIPSGTISC